MTDFAETIATWVLDHQDSDLSTEDAETLKAEVLQEAETVLTRPDLTTQGRALEAIATRHGAPGAVTITDTGYELHDGTGTMWTHDDTAGGRVLEALDGRTTEAVQ